MDRHSGGMGRLGIPACSSRPQGTQLFWFFVLSLFVFPIAVVIAYAVEDRT
jgi:hypothetical protein